MHHVHSFLKFLSLSFLVTLIVYLPARMVSWTAALFLVIAFGNAHYLIAYLANIRIWRDGGTSVPRRFFTWLFLLLFYLLLFYKFLSFGAALFSIVVFAAIHIIRDFNFFLTHIRSGRGERSWLGTALVGSIYLAIFFAIFIFNPQYIFFFFLSSLPYLLFVYAFLFALIFFLIASVIAFHEWRRWLSFFYLSIGLIGASPLLVRLNPIDYVYVLVLWHFVLWIFFTYRKTGTVSSKLFLSRLFTQRNLFTTLILVSHACLIVIPLLFVFLGFYTSSVDIVYRSFLFGLLGYPLWSFAHIAFSSLQPIRRQIKD